MDIPRLREVQSRERSTDSLQDLPESFYSDVAAYVEDLKTERERAAARADDPFDDPEVNRLSDEIDTVEQVAESIYERRVGKLVKQASFAAADMGGDDTGLTAEERDLYRDLVERIGENKTRVLDVLGGRGDAANGSATEATGAAETADSEGPASAAGSRPPEPDPVDAASLMGDGTAAETPGDGGGESAAPRAADTDAGAGPSSDAAEREVRGADSTPDEGEPVPGSDSARATAGAGDAGAEPDSGSDADTATGAPETNREAPGAEPDSGVDTATERATVQVTRDVGEILGVDERVYDLESDDVVTLPAENATPLVEKGAADRLD